jgi:hypothetical protein
VVAWNAARRMPAHRARLAAEYDPRTGSGPC